MGGSKRKIVVLTGSATAVVAATPFVGVGAAEAASFNVTNLNDSGAGSLRQALLDANGAAGPDVITFQAGLTGTIVLTTGDIGINDSVDIQGPGAAVLTVSGNNASRIFYLYNSQNTPIDVTISGLTLTAGADDDGGAIHVFGEVLELDEMVITENVAQYQGGGVYFSANYVEASGQFGQLTITDSEISGNHAEDGGGVYVNYSGDPLLISNTTVSGNYAEDNGGGLALYSTTSTVTITDSRIVDNDAYGVGGGIYLYDTDGGEVHVVRSTISGNEAGDDGGGIYFYDLDDSVVIDSSTISGNYSGDDGGGIYVRNEPQYLSIVNSTISGNYADSRGGGIFLGQVSAEELTSIDHSTITDNYAVDGGGGIYLYGSGVDLFHTIVSGNSTDGGDQDLDGANFFLSADWSLLGDTPTPGSGANNIYYTNPGLESLADNGGPTETHAPMSGSPALEAGDPAITGEPEFDQRGEARVDGIIEIGAVEENLGPVDDAYSVNEDAVLNVAVPGVLDNDVPGGLATVVLETGPAHGTLSLNADGSFTYTPAANFHGADSFVYSLLVGQPTSLEIEPEMEPVPTATVAITVNAVNDPPVAQNDTAAATVGVGSSVTVQTNDSDADGDPLTIVGVTQGAKGTVVIQGNTVRYTANQGASGTDTFTYTISDGSETSTATVTVTITGGRIPDTGSSSWSLVFVAAGLLGAGAALTGSSRRRRTPA